MTNENTQNQEVAIVETQVAEIVQSENDDYVIVKNAEGKFVRKAKFKEFSSIHPKDRKEQIWLLNLMEGSEETGQGLKEHVGKQIEVADVITRRYDRINEETGQTEYGVLTYLLTPDRIAYVTSSKTVYFTIVRIMDLFGTPDSPEWVNVMVKVGKQKGQNGDIINIKMIG